MSTVTVNKPIKRKKSKSYLNKFTPVDAVIYFVITLFSIICVYPFINLLFQAISPNWVIQEARGVLLWPKEITFANFAYVWDYPNVWNAYKNTIFVTVVGTCNSLLWTTMAGYALSDRELPGRMAMTIFLLITRYVGGGLIPTYLLFRQLGLLNTIWVMIIPDAIGTGNVLLMRNFFLGMSKELKESAYLDGASEVQTLLRVVLPLSMPIIATITLFLAVGNWEEYSTPIMFITDTKKHPIQVILQKMYTKSVEQASGRESINSAASEVTPDAVKAATVIFVTVPILVAYPFAQKHFNKGVMIGSLKG